MPERVISIIFRTVLDEIQDNFKRRITGNQELLQLDVVHFFGVFKNTVTMS